MTKDFCTILVLLYGDYHTLHKRCLESIIATVPAQTGLRIGLNEVCSETLEWLESGAIDPQLLIPGTLEAGNTSRGIEQGRVLYYSSGNKNIKKYPMMRRMLYEDQINTPWVLWFDDDTHIADPASRWWDKFRELASNTSNMYIGETWLIHYRGNQWQFVMKRPWYTGKPPKVISGKPGIPFHTGGFVGVRMSWLKKLDWPDRAINHNGGDQLLSEAIRQNAGRLTKFPTKEFGIKVNAAQRRGYSETPAGVK